MRHYFFRRLLLLPPTLLGILMVAFALTRLVPGGPVEQALAEAREAREQRGAGRPAVGGATGDADALTPEQTRRLRAYYGFDRPVVPAFFEWLGAWPRELPGTVEATVAPGDGATARVTLQSRVEADADAPFVFDATVRRVGESDYAVAWPEAEVAARATAWLAGVPAERRDAARRGVEAACLPWRVEPVEPAGTPGKPVRVKVFQTGFSGVLQGDFGRSFIHGRPVGELIRSRLPVSIWFGAWSLLITYLVAVPLGVIKATRHGGAGDAASSLALFVASSIPGYIVAVVLVLVFSFRLHWFPHSGLTGPEFDTLGVGGKLLDLARHTVLPLAAMTAGSLAMTVLLMKNALLDNLGADHVRTAVAKGAPFRRVVMRHAFRLSLLPLATGFGGVVGALLTGNFLVERIFDINGFGLLSFTALVGRDYPVFLANLSLGALAMLVGNLVSDLCVALVDPRVRFDR